MMTVFEVSGYGSTISQHHHPAIELDPQKKYGIGLLLFSSFNSIPNIHKGCNKFYFGNGEVIEIPTGSYELDDIDKFIRKRITTGKIKMRANNNTMQTEITASHSIDFSKEDSIGTLLGYDKILVPAGNSMSTKLVTIFNVNLVNVECNVSTGSYKNGGPDRTIHQFVPNVPPGYKLISSPINPTFFPITTRFIDTLEFTLTDQNGDLIDFRHELVSMRVMVKEIDDEDYLSKN
jgi:hypothetical protein